MTTHIHRFVLFAAFMLLIGASTTMSATAELRPLAVTLDGHAAPVFQPDGCTIINDEQGSGQARHLGAISWQSHEVVDVCSNPDGADVVGEFILMAANGDQVFGSYQTLAHLDFGAGEVRALGAFQITGGTGRFADASGQGIISAVGSLLPPFGVIGQMTGVIAY
jgi:hypothetical protein